jgi:hypothetical protein
MNHPDRTPVQTGRTPVQTGLFSTGLFSLAVAVSSIGLITTATTAVAETLDPAASRKTADLTLGRSAGLVATCAYDTNSGKPNPLGLRAFITALEVNGDTTFTFEQFPSNISSGEAISVPATIAQQRRLTFYRLAMQPARELMLKNPRYYEELLGYKPDGKGYPEIDSILLCKNADGSTIGTGVAKRGPKRCPMRRC